MSLLFTPLELGSLTLRNRLAVSPMCMYSSLDGLADDFHLVHYGSRAVGGAGLVILEATAVRPEGRITPDDLGIWDDSHIEPLRRITDFIHHHGALAGIQLAHAGRKASTSSEWKGSRFLQPGEGGWRTVSASALPYSDESGTPHELTTQEIGAIRQDFARAAERAVRAGFRVLELHAAHGYLLHQFLSPLTNHRKDAYGGSFENRVRMLLETVDAVRAVTPQNVSLWVRISATDWADGGWDEEQSVRLAALLKEKGVEVLDVSTGGLVPYAKIEAGYGYQVPFAARIKRETDMKVATVGLITGSVQAETILRTGDADLILMGRELLRDPYFPLRAAHELRDEVQWPVQYTRGKWR